MPPVYYYRTAAATYTDISEYFRLYKLDTASNAEEGSVAQWTVVADDPTGALEIVGLRDFIVQESTATGSNTRIAGGYTAARRYTRGPYRTTVGREIQIDIVDLNTILHRRVMVGGGNKRPAETDVARLQWLLSTSEAFPITDTLYLNTSGAVAMDAADYNGQKFSDVIDDCAQQSGKNWFTWYREDAGTFSLWYDFSSSTSYSSPLRLTNVQSEVDDTWTFAISNDTQLSRSPDRVNSGAYLPYDGGTVYEQSITTANNFMRRDAVMPAENVKTLAKATARANRYLLSMNSEEDVITTTVLLPAAKVNFLMQGMRVQLKATHLPDYESGVMMRVLNRSVLQVSEEFYEVRMEMASAPTPVEPGMFQHTENASTNSETENGIPVSRATLDTPPGVGSILVAAWVMQYENFGGHTWPSGWTEIGTVELYSPTMIGPCKASLRYKVSDGAADQSLVMVKGGTYYTYTGLAELVGVTSLIDSSLADNVPDALPPAPEVGPVTVTEDGQIVIGFATIAGINNTITLSAGFTEMENGLAGATGSTTFAYKVGTVGDHTLNATSNTTGSEQGAYMGAVAVFG